MRRSYQPESKAVVVLVALVLIPLFLIAGASGQMGVFILVSSALLAIDFSSQFFERCGLSRLALPQLQYFPERFQRPPPSFQ
jgi:hypothetical protein